MVGGILLLLRLGTRTLSTLLSTAGLGGRTRGADGLGVAAGLVGGGLGGGGRHCLG